MATPETTPAADSPREPGENDIRCAGAPPPYGSAAGSPSAANVIVGLGGIGVRAVASIGVAGRAALRPGAELARAAWRAPAAAPARNRTDRALEALDASGRVDADRARARLVSTMAVAIEWVLDGVRASPQADRLRERVMRSDQLAGSRVGAGLPGRVEDGVRRPSVSADHPAERIARKLLRRALRRNEAPTETAPPARTHP